MRHDITEPAHHTDHAVEALVVVQPLNDAPSGPVTADAALAIARKHCHVGKAAGAQFRADLAAGAEGPWHFVYGFTSVTLARVAPMAEPARARR